MRDNDGYRPVLAALVLCRLVPNDSSKMYAPRKLIDCPTTNENLTNALRSCVAHRHGPPVKLQYSRNGGLFACIEPNSTTISTCSFQTDIVNPLSLSTAVFILHDLKV